MFIATLHHAAAGYSLQILNRSLQILNSYDKLVLLCCSTWFVPTTEQREPNFVPVRPRSLQSSLTFEHGQIKTDMRTVRTGSHQGVRDCACERASRCRQQEQGEEEKRKDLPRSMVHQFKAVPKDTSHKVGQR